MVQNVVLHLSDHRFARFCEDDFFTAGVAVCSHHLYHIDVGEFCDTFTDGRMCAIMEIMNDTEDGRSRVVTDIEKYINRIFGA